ncbi:hypothetical protein C8R47DRAFT_1315263 [Mycena vitilis]|nr:hypothetical protein C8R47DRAFT_1315263 [Mycena vitilis]
MATITDTQEAEQQSFCDNPKPLKQSSVGALYIAGHKTQTGIIQGRNNLLYALYVEALCICHAANYLLDTPMTAHKLPFKSNKIASEWQSLLGKKKDRILPGAIGYRGCKGCRCYYLNPIPEDSREVGPPPTIEDCSAGSEVWWRISPKGDDLERDLAKLESDPEFVHSFQAPGSSPPKQERPPTDWKEALMSVQLKFVTWADDHHGEIDFTVYDVTLEELLQYIEVPTEDFLDACRTAKRFSEGPVEMVKDVVQEWLAPVSRLLKD